MALSDSPAAEERLNVLAVTQGQWGERIADNVTQHCPPTWLVQRWAAPRALPQLIDDPAEFLPATFPTADLLLALGEQRGVAQLVPEIARRCGARSVIAPIDRNESLPPGLVTQLRVWLAELGVRVVFPVPFCSLTETTYNLPPLTVGYQDPFIQRFAHWFGRPQFKVSVSPDRRLTSVEVVRDSACGCARHVADGLVGRPVDEAEYEAGMLHHHYPCLASMNQDADYHDTLMHVSGNVMRSAIREEVRVHLSPTAYFQPAGRAEADHADDTGSP